MANTIITKNSSTVSDVPTAGQLETGELAIATNPADRKLYSKDSGGTVFEIGGGGGGGGAWTFVSTSSPSAVSSVEFKDLTESSYMLILQNVVPATDDAFLRLTASNNNGSSYVTVDYQWALMHIRGTTDASTGSTSASYIDLQFFEGTGSGGGEFGVSGVMIFNGINDANNPMSMNWQTIFQEITGDLVRIVGSGITADDQNTGSTKDVDALKLVFDVGNFESGDMHLYKLVTA